MVTLKDILEYNDDEIANLVKFYFPNNEAIEKSEEFELFKEANENDIGLYIKRLNNNLSRKYNKEKLDKHEEIKKNYPNEFIKKTLDEHEEIKKNYPNEFIKKTNTVFANNIKSLNQYIKNNDSLDQINNDEIIFYLLNYESYHHGSISNLLYELNKENLTEKFIEILIKKDKKIIEKISTHKDFNSFLYDIHKRKNDIVNYVKEYELKIENPSSVDKKNEDLNNQTTEENHDFEVITLEDCEQFELVDISKAKLTEKLL